MLLCQLYDSKSKDFGVYGGIIDIKVGLVTSNNIFYIPSSPVCLDIQHK